MPRVPLVIPAYQPSTGLIDIVHELSEKGFERILIVNDGSDPSHRPIFEKLAALENVSVLELATNLGKGAALKFAFNHILVHYPDAAGAVTVDADGQHHPEDVVRVAEAFSENPKKLLLGCRVFERDVPLRSRFGNILTRYIFQFLVGKKLSDTQTGLRGIPAKLMTSLLSVRSNRYEFELDMLVLAAQSRTSLQEVPIRTIYENGNRSSHFNPLRDSLRIYFVFFRFIVSSLLTYAADLSVFSIVYYYTSNILAGVIAGRAAGLVVTTIASKTFVFKSRSAYGEVFAKMFLLWSFLLVLSYGLTVMAAERFGFNIYVSRLLIDSTLFLLNFVVQREFVFKELPVAEPAL